MAVSDALRNMMSPYRSLFQEIMDAVYSTPERIPEFKEEYLERISQISEEECSKAVRRYVKCVLNSLYAGNWELCDRDVSRLITDGEPSEVELTDRKRTVVTALLVDVYRKLYGKTTIYMQ